ncbi:MAG TPA: hypothetical protein VGL46_09445 [Pseudonocardiaceae bacterium]|jgi:hypothetical protein
MPNNIDSRYFVRPYREGLALDVIAKRRETSVAEVLQVLARAGERLKPRVISQLPAHEQTTLARQITNDTAHGLSDDSLARKYGLPAHVLAALRDTIRAAAHEQPSHPKTLPPPSPPPAA